MRFSVLALLLGITLTATGQTLPGFTTATAREEFETETKFKDLTDWSAFRNHLQTLTREPHTAGSAANERVRDYMSSVMTKAGWKSELFPYDLYMPKEPGTSQVTIVEPIRMPLNNQEAILKEDPFSTNANLWPGWNAWSGNGDVTAEVVYANFGRKEDFEKLEALGISVKGKIAIVRYGGNFRGYKVKYAEAHGAVGVIIYSDPADAGYMRGLTYPEGAYFNESTIQRGSLLTLDYTGDALTPFEPALPRDGKTKVKRLDPAAVPLHTIPATPLPYGAAKEILQRMTGKLVPQGWQGGLPFAYRTEGGSALKVRLAVEQKKDFVRCYDVIGTLTGSERPDEWIILGCHYDAWAFGATDPNSGTAMLLSLAETLGKMARQGIRPKRSIKIAHWDAEEHGVIGSTEWVEQMKTELGAKGVAYVNLDAGVSGRNFGAASSPTLKQLLIDATQTVDYPDSAKTLYQHWKGKSKGKEPNLGNLGGGSDHIGFYMHVGVPSINPGTHGPTLYHSNYDDFTFYEKFADPTFKMGGMMEQLIGIIALRLANAPIIPYDVKRYATDLRTHLGNANKNVRRVADSTAFAGFTQANEALKSLEAATKAFDAAYTQKLAKADLTATQASAINTQLIALEKSFIDPKGMYYGSWYRSLYASPDPFSGYASWMLPGIQYELDMKSTARLPEWDTRYAQAIRKLTTGVETLTTLLSK